MSEQTIDDQIRVMQAYAAGKSVACRKRDGDDDWETMVPRWNWAQFDYKVVEGDIGKLVGKVLVSKRTSVVCVVVAVDKRLRIASLGKAEHNKTLDELDKDYTMEDGTGVSEFLLKEEGG
jgi:hypothetical protein